MRPRHTQRGVTLLETLIALAILGMIGSAFMTALVTGTRSSRTLDEQVQAESLARSQLEDIKNTAYNSTPTCYPDCYARTVTEPPQYTVTVTTAKVATPVADTLCDATDNCLQKITVTVSRVGKPVLSLTAYKKQ